MKSRFSRKRKTQLLWRRADIEREEKIISEKGNGGETLETNHMVYYFPLSSPLRDPGLGVYPAENQFF